jgi:hypothetical protein
MVNKLNCPLHARLTGYERIVVYRLFCKKHQKKGTTEGR